MSSDESYSQSSEINMDELWSAKPLFFLFAVRTQLLAHPVTSPTIMRLIWYKNIVCSYFNREGHQNLGSAITHPKNWH